MLGRRARITRYHLGQAEVQDLHLAFRRDLDVGGFQIPMDDPLLMCRLQSFSDLQGHWQRFVDGDRTFGNAICQGWTLDQLEDKGLSFADVLDAVDSPDVGMIQRGQDFGFPLEATHSLAVGGELLGQDFERHVAVELSVGSPVDLTHAAFAELGGYFIVSDSLADHLLKPSADPSSGRGGRQLADRPSILAGASWSWFEPGTLPAPLQAQPPIS